MMMRLRLTRYVCDRTCVKVMMELNDEELMQLNEERFANEEPWQLKPQWPKCMRHHDASWCRTLSTWRLGEDVEKAEEWRMTRTCQM